MSRPNPGIYSGQYPSEYEKYNTQYGGQIESIGWKWWDTQNFVTASTTSLTNYFNVRATPDLSNMEVAFQLAAPKAFLARSIRVFYKQRPGSTARGASAAAQPGIMDNVVQIANTGVLTLTIGNKQYAQEPLWALTAGAGIGGFMALEGATADPGGEVDYGQIGIADPRAVNTFSKPIFIAPQINFNVRIDWPAALTVVQGPIPITVLLDGDLLRPVQ